ncbi:hypothetical protein [Methylotenera sp.]|uniref:deoxynucleotide monophosphate kinase family protein n=1 Tax=Methylotenera sp. TaxID=2051956 RepID=UPI00248794A1|nr:hypothetical protein [Methylotenera sp.]MDI1360632.1 hypothetical protein [Methylotenera sp.]
MLLALAGKAGAGKNTVADMLSEHFNFQQTAFADPLKTAAALIFGLDVEHFYSSDLKEIVDPFWGISPREMLQKLGTEACRNNIDQNIWVKSMQRSCAEVIANNEDLVITDARFDNEADMVRALGGTVIHIHSNRESKLNATSQAHLSEAGIEFKGCDYVIDNSGTLLDLKHEVSIFMEDYYA